MLVILNGGQLMGFIPQVKCNRCDRKYSGLRNRCPFCGARRHKKGKRVSDTDNSVWKLIIGVLLLVVLIAAVVVLLVTSANDNSGDVDNPGTQQGGTPNSGDGVTGTNTPENPDDPDDPENPDDPSDPSTGTTPDDPDTPDTPDTPDDPVTPPAPVLNSVAITYGGRRLAYNEGTGVYEFSMKVSDAAIILKATTDPADYEGTPVWEISDESVATILQSGKVTPLKKGTATITVTIGDKTDSCLIRVNG